MEIGISTASLFVRKTTEDALQYLSEQKVPVAEVFLSTYLEYTRAFGSLLKSRLGPCTKVHSVHTLTTQFEPQLYSVNPRAAEDAFRILDGVLDAAAQVGAGYYTFHGVALMKKTPVRMDYERIGEITRDIFARCAARGVTLCYENVHWCYYNKIGFFSEVRSRCPGLKGVLDIKQARLSCRPYSMYLKEMAGRIAHVHVSDVDERGRICLPGRGIFDFPDLIRRLADTGFDGPLLIEVYKNDFSRPEELKESCDYLSELVDKYGCRARRIVRERPNLAGFPQFCGKPARPRKNAGNCPNRVRRSVQKSGMPQKQSEGNHSGKFAGRYSFGKEIRTSFAFFGNE